MRTYIFQILRRAFLTSFGVADFLSSMVGALLGVIQHFAPQTRDSLTNLAWEIPLWCLGVTLAARIVVAPYWIWKESVAEISRLRSEIDKAKADTMYSVTLTPDVHVDQTSLNQCRIRVGFNIKSTQPIWFEVKEMAANVFGKEAPQMVQDIERKSGLVLPEDKKGFSLDFINDLPFEPKKWEGSFKYRIVYGLPHDREKYYYEKNSTFISVPDLCREHVLSERRGFNPAG